jgi:hypothetical protein
MKTSYKTQKFISIKDIPTITLLNCTSIMYFLKMLDVQCTEQNDLKHSLAILSFGKIVTANNYSIMDNANSPWLLEKAEFAMEEK